ncbi:MAG: hypothetical protein ISS25_01100 [Nanoarchaeota archaeon]|nr:hypothetical protein [DPANN group archaeon]MBL7116411.1 hypothetical protein [Nanoarchaeota archaeon]
MNVLFICKWNRFRSKVAEAYFNERIKGSAHKAKSAGFIYNLPISKEIFDITKKAGLNITSTPVGLDLELLRWADEIIITADDVPPYIFDEKEIINRKITVWEFKDEDESDEAGQLKLVEAIKKKIDEFVREF